jgi:nucleoside-diphosphate-sugar epimerase
MYCRDFYRGQRVILTAGFGFIGSSLARQLVGLGADVRQQSRAQSGRVQYVDWPPEKKATDIGRFYADSTKFNRKTGWSPRVPLREGLERTMASDAHY